MLKNKLLIWLVAVAAVTCGGRVDDRAHSVILITLDTTRADFLSTYGYPESITPHLDQLAAEGSRFDLAISTAAVTPVSHASILTGLNNQAHGLRVLSAAGGFRLRPDVPTLATVLQEHGYHTAAIHSAFPVSAHFGLDRGFEAFESFALAAIHPRRLTRPGRRLQRRSDDTTDLVLTFLKEIEDPYFLWVHYWDPHDRVLLPPAKFMQTVGEGSTLEEGVGAVLSSNRSVYAAEVRFMDSQIGRIFQHLRESGKDDQTMIVVVSDHGQGLGDHGWGFHRILYQEQIRVPLIIKVPWLDQVDRLLALVRTTDIFPTVLEILGIELPMKVSGKSLLQMMEGDDESGRIAFADQINSFDLNAEIVSRRPHDDFLYCAMDREWKLIYRPTRPEQSELFNLVEDPAEQRNLYRRRPEEALRLMRELAESSPWVTAPFTSEGGSGDLAATRSALSALGYMGGKREAVSGPSWSWVCPGRPDQVSTDRRRGDCPTPLIPVARTALR
ncbi:MAG: sulfatase [Thermoanaerobaculia bacterium]